jgi:competence protein ComEC
MLLSVLVVGRRWRMASQLLVILSIWAYVFLVGLPVSVVRSAVMLTVYALLSLGHRQKMSVNVLAFTAIVMLCCNPMALFDVGFQLSFMAVFAILLFMPLLEGAIPRKFLLTHRLVNWLWAMVCISLSAQTGVAPLIAFYFDRFSTWFLLTNFIVVPAATLILYLSLLVLLIPSCAMLLIYAVRALNYILSQIASLPLASIDGLQPSMWQVALMYIVIGAVWLWLKKTAIRAPE